VAPSRPALLVGQVIDGVSGRAVPGVIVTLGGPPASNGIPHPRVLTGNDGRFVFRDLRRGDYSITASKGGYADGAYGRTRAGGPSTSLPIGEGERAGDVVIRLWKNASISGTVVDESGERLVGVEVRGYRRSVVAGRRRFAPVGSGRTDDRGIYRLGNLIPGDYIVGTVGRHITLPLSTMQAAQPGSTERMIAVEAGLASVDDRRFAMMQSDGAGIALGRGSVTPPPPANGRYLTYTPTYHPNASAGESAAVVTLRPGEEYLSADLQLSPVRAVRLSGTVIGPDGPVTRATLRLMPANTVEIPGTADVPSALTDNAGNFAFAAVASGDYRLRLVRSGPPVGGVSTGLAWLDEPVTVGNEDLAVTLTASPGVVVSGRVEFEGDLTRNRTSLSGVTIQIEPVEWGSAGSAVFNTRTSTNGEFVSQPIQGGQYYLRVPNSPQGWMFKGVTVDGRDATDTPISLTSNLPNVIVTFSDRWSGIRGAVQGASGRDPAALVVVFPADRDMWGSSGLNPRRVRSSKPSKSGDYSLNLPPGDYYVAAIPDEYSDWQDPDVIDRISRLAVRVTIAEGERKVQDLRTREPR
jgi:hypothetical protein